MPGTLTTNWLDPLFWGTSTGGAAGSAETTNTLGIDRLDNRVPPDQFHIGGLQISQVKNLVLQMSQYFQGGTRLKVLTQSANPFGASEIGYYADNTALPNPRFSANGTLTTIANAAVTTKGDLCVFNGTNFVRLPSGSDTQILIADSTQSTGLRWGAASGGGGVAQQRHAVADANYSTVAADTVIAYTSITLPRTVTGLTTTGTATVPFLLYVTDESGSASATNTITFAGSAGNIDGVASKVIINGAHGWWVGYNNGSNWFTLASSITSATTTNHLIGGGSAPTVAVQANAGTGATASIVSGTDTDFELQIVSGTGATAGAWAIVTFSTPFAAKPFCVVNGSNGPGAGDGTASGYSMYYDRTNSSDAGHATFSMGTALGSSSTTFKWNVHVIG